MADFPHLKLPFKVEGGYTPNGGGNNKNQATTEANKSSNRQAHSEKLKNSIDKLRNTLSEFRALKKKGSSALPNETDIPVFLKTDGSSFDIDSLKHWGIEVVSEEENGFIIGASVDGLKAFETNVNDFIEQKGIRKDAAAKIWDLELESTLRIENLLKGELKHQWGNLENGKDYFVELGVTCHVPMDMDYPRKSDFDLESKYNSKISEFDARERACQIARGEIQIKRESEVEGYLKTHKGELIDIWDNDTDSIYFKIKINVNGLRDIIFTFQFLNSISFSPDFEIEKIENSITFSSDAEFIQNTNAPKVCVIDSGIQEEHVLLKGAIDSANSRNYVDDGRGVSDFVSPSGHGTQVAGAVLFPITIPKSGKFVYPSVLQNARILDSKNKISDTKFVPALLNQIINDFSETKLFNLSISENFSYQETHMHQLSASIDKLIHEKDVLFIISSGNLGLSSRNSSHPGVNDYLTNGIKYPDYLETPESKIANPGKSLFALTVGSIGHLNFEDNDFISLAGENYVSPFSRVGFGMWDSIKPEVVEYGGDFASHKITGQAIVNPNLAVELVNSTRHGSPAFGKETVGTSYSAPKVSNIVSAIMNEHPNETALMYKALVIQGARHPEHCFDNPSTRDFKFYGYGIANLERSLSNNASRITFIQNGKLGGRKADIYKLNIPEQLRGEGKNYKLLVEITLVFSAKTKLTRKGAHSYLSTWLEWKSSKYGENFNSFRNRTVENLDMDEAGNSNVEEGEGAIKWVLRENPLWSNIKINRNSSTSQKSWALIEPHQLTEDFSIAVLGHVGWDKNLKNEIPYALCVSFESTHPETNVYSLMAEAQVPISAEIEIEL